MGKVNLEPYQELEKKFAEWNELPPENMVACSSGTAALHLALEALQLPQGSALYPSEVITSDFNMIAVPRAIVMAGHKPFFVDCDENLLMDFKLERQVPVTAGSGLGEIKPLILVHIYGRRCTSQWCDWAGWPTPVIEDLAEAHGIKPWSCTDAACWSFYKNKIIAGEEGGAVYFKNVEHAKLARSLRSLGFTEAHDFNHIPRGHNYRMSNAHARLILESLKEADNNLIKRSEIAGLYDYFCPAEWRMPKRDVNWVYDLRIKGMSSEVQGRVVTELNRSGIPARHAFKPMSCQEEFHDRVYEESNAYVASREVFYLPILPGTTDETEIKRTFDVIYRALV